MQIFERQSICSFKCALFSKDNHIFEIFERQFSKDIFSKDNQYAVLNAQTIAFHQNDALRPFPLFNVPEQTYR